MNYQHFLFFLLLLACLFSNQVSKSQNFSVRTVNDTAIIEVHAPFKAYTYNQYHVTDSSLVVTAPSKQIDIIIADFKKNNRIFINFRDIQELITLKNQTIEAGDSAIFSINLTQQSIPLFLHTNHECELIQVIDETGVHQVSEIVRDSILLNPKKFHVFNATSTGMMPLPLKIQLKQNNKIIEKKNGLITFKKAIIKLDAILQDILTTKSEKEILYLIESSKPIVSTLNLEVLIDITYNGEQLSMKDRITLEKGTTRTHFKVSKKIHGRLPRKFIVHDIKILPFPSSANASYELE